MSAFDELDQVGLARHGLIKVATASEVLSRGQIRHRRETGQLDRVNGRVLRMAGSPKTAEQRLLGAVWGAGDGAVASHRSAAALWGLLEEWPPCPEVTIRGPRLPRLTSVSIHRSKDLADDWVAVHRDIPTTNPQLTMVHLGAVCQPVVVRDALERGIVAQLFSVTDVEAALRRFGKPGRNGAGVLRTVLAHRAMGDERTDSVLESRMGSIFVRFALPKPIFHFVVRTSGQFVAEVDFAYPELRVAIEVDGWSVHGTPDAMTADFVRQNKLMRLGWTVIRFTWAQVTREPDYVAGEIARTLSAIRVV